VISTWASSDSRIPLSDGSAKALSARPDEPKISARGSAAAIYRVISVA
jgi:hypothetical protein